MRFPSRTGVWWSTDSLPIARVRDAAVELEALGYGSLWFGEAYGKEAFTQSGALLGATTRLVVGTGIANIHARDALAAESGGRTLTALHPGRFVLGLGVSHAPLVTRRAGTYTKPLARCATTSSGWPRCPSRSNPAPGDRSDCSPRSAR